MRRLVLLGFVVLALGLSGPAVLAEAKLIILPGVSHFAMLQDPGQFNAAMLAFLAGR